MPLSFDADENMSSALGFSNDDGLPSQGWKLYVVSLVMILLAGVTVIARCATRIVARQLGSDDYAIICSLVCQRVVNHFNQVIH